MNLLPPLLEPIVEFTGDLFHFGQELRQLRMGLLLLGQVRANLVSELDVTVDPAADMGDERQRVIQGRLDLSSFLLLLLAAVDLLQRVSGRARGTPHFLLFLPFHLQDVLAGSDSQTVSHDIDDREPIGGRLREAVDRIDEGRPLERQRPVLHGLHVAASFAIGPARILEPTDHRGPPFSVRTDARRASAHPGRFQVAVPLFLLEQHLPTVSQIAAPGEIDPPLGFKRHFPVEARDLLGLFGSHVGNVPDLRGLHQGHPDLSALAEGDFRPGDDPLVAFSRERNFDVLLAVLEHAHDDGVFCARRMQQEVLARHLDDGHGDFAGVDHNVVGEEIRQNDEPARTVDA